MADEQDQQLKHWQTMKTQAENGELRMESDVAENLVKRCDDQLARLDVMVEDANDLQYVAGFGSLRSATQLAEKFQDKAVNDEDSAVNRLNQSIEIVKLMRATFDLAGKQLSDTDEQTGQALGNTGADMP